MSGVAFLGPRTPFVGKLLTFVLADCINDHTLLAPDLKSSHDAAERRKRMIQESKFLGKIYFGLEAHFGNTSYFKRYIFCSFSKGLVMYRKIIMLLAYSFRW